MDFWGFEDRSELPGEGFLFLQQAGSPPTSTPPPPAGGAIKFGGENGTPSGITPTPEFANAGTQLKTEYDGLLGWMRGAGATPPDKYTYDFFKESPANRTEVQNWWNKQGRPNADPRYDLSAIDRRVSTLTDLQNRYSIASDKMNNPGANPNYPTIRSEATGVMGEIQNAYGRPAQGGGGGSGSGGVQTASTEGGGTGFVDGMRSYNEGAGVFNEAVGRTMAPVMTALGGANVINQQARALSGQGGSANASFGIGGDFGASAGGGYGSSVGVASYGDAGGFSAYGGGMGDLTGTSFTIGSMGGDARSKSRAIDALINQMLNALRSGNLDVLETLATLCTQKARMTVASAAIPTIRAMQLYDRQMQQISNQMGALAGQGNTQTMAPQLAQFNLQANQLSSGRQMIANSLKDIMGMLEEIGNSEKGIRDTMSRIKSTQSRWS